MNQQWIEIANLPLFTIVFRKWEMVIVYVEENFVESAEKSCHGKVHASMAKIHCGINKYWLRFFIAHEIPTPKIAVQQSRWFISKYLG